MNTQCDECSSTGMEPTNFDIGLQSDSDTSSDDDDIDETDNAEENTKDSVTYYEWARGDDNKLMKMMSNKSVENKICLLETTIKVLKRHIYVKRVQYRFYDNYKKKLGKNDLLVHVDYSES